MTFTDIIRRTASRVVPCASRLLQKQRYYNNHHHRRYFSSFLASRSAASINNHGGAGMFPSNIQRYSTIPKPDWSLIKILEAEIQCVVDSADNDMLAEEARGDFPFEIEEIPARETMILRREFKGEKISVEVYMPNLVPEFGEIPLTIKVLKKSGVFLEFAATVDNGYLEIVSLTINDPNVQDDPFASVPPPFKDLDYDLQKAFVKYLDRRKVSPVITEFLQGYTTNKDTKEFSDWYNNVKHFVKSDSG